MFFGKKKEKVISPLKGEVIPLEKVKDPVFSQGLMGKGCAIIPTKDVKDVCAPIDGTIIVLPETCHAFGIRTNKGIEYLVHIGIDTVNLHGEGFQAHKKEGDVVKAGEVVITLEESLFEKGYDLTTILVCTSKENEKIGEIDYQAKHQGDTLFQM